MDLLESSQLGCFKDLKLCKNRSCSCSVFHVSVLRKYMVDPSHVLDYQPIQITNDMSYEEQPMEILERNEQVLRRRVISLV